MIYIKILQVISGNDNGGGANHVINICKNNTNDMNCVIAAIGEGSLYDKAFKEGILIVSFSFKEIIKGKLEDYIKDNKIEIVNFHGAKSNFLYAIIKKKIKIPCVVTIHSDYRYDFLNSKLKRYIYTPLSILGLKKFNNYVCVSNYLKDLLNKNNFLGNKYVVENGINIGDFKITNEREATRQKYKIKDEDFVYIMVARMHPIKNHDRLIEAFKKLSLEFENVKLMLVGDGDLKEALENKVLDLDLKNKVIFTGFKNNTIEYINASEISVLTSLNEGGAPPLVILESAVANKTTICSNVGDMKNIINESNGFLVNPLSQEDIYIKMKEVYIKKEELKLKGENLLNLVKERFNIEIFWKNYYEVYKNILSE